MTTIKGSLSWFSPLVGDQVGYGYAAVNLIRAFNHQNIRVNYCDTEENVHVNWVQPEMYCGEKYQIRIGYTPWESSKLPNRWAEMMNGMDEIWTPTTYCRDVFIAEGVEVPVHVVPHGVNADHFPIVRDRKLEGEFRFLHMGGPTERKGGRMVVKAFLELFDGDENVKLIMKSSGPSEARFYPEPGILRNISKHPQVTVIEESLSQESLLGLYGSAHCMVYPGNGEGFGFIPFQGIATGLPTILTNGTGMADFAHLGVPLSYTEVEGNGLHLGTWMRPNYKELLVRMKNVYDHWEQYSKEAISNAEVCHREWSWDAAAIKAIDILGDRISL